MKPYKPKTPRPAAAWTAAAMAAAITISAFVVLPATLDAMGDGTQTVAAKPNASLARAANDGSAAARRSPESQAVSASDSPPARRAGAVSERTKSSSRARHASRGLLEGRLV